ncbi:hypothetical protein BgiBS90_029476 [Biomphalaria glabrata]|nr:hypothetical protein BgiBS90_029476 [Biomphalaria glabrata]
MRQNAPCAKTSSVKPAPPKRHVPTTGTIQLWLSTNVRIKEIEFFFPRDIEFKKVQYKTPRTRSSVQESRNKKLSLRRPEQEV